MATTVKLTGFKELEQSLGELSRAVGKGAVRRALITSAEPLARKMRANAPKGATHDLSEGIDVGTRLSRRQASLHKKMFSDDRAAVEVFVGAKSDPGAHMEEFGSINNTPRPFARPAWDEDKEDLLRRLGVEMWDEIGKSVERVRKRAAK